jgi:tetratricopeptide (TPR) repeat protein
MLKNIVFIMMTLAFLAACGSGSQSNSAVSAFEKGSTLVAEANKLLAEGQDRSAKKIFTAAIIELEKAAKNDANQEGLASLLGESQYRIRDFDNAIQWLNKAVGQDKEDPKNYQYLGYCQVNKSAFKEAEANFKRAFALDKSDKIKDEAVKELTDIGELSLSLGDNFTEQGNPAQGVQFKKLGMRIMALALEYTDYDMTLARKIKEYAVEMNDQILMDWIENIIINDGETTIIIKQ